MNLGLVLLQAGGGGGAIAQIVMLAAIFAIFYFFMIRPQQKKQKDTKKFLDEIKRGDSVVTIGGMHGKVAEIDAESVTLDVDKGVKLKFDRGAISMESTKKLKA